ATAPPAVTTALPAVTTALPAVAAAPPEAVAPPAAPIAAFVQPVAAEAAPTTAILEPAMLTLSGGEFRMGSNDDPSERPPHLAVLAPFLLANHAVTVGEWQQCVDAKACPAIATGKPGEPVTNVSWDDAHLFLAWLSKTTGQLYRLPTEAEWEYAARAGTSTRYAWGNAMMPGRASCKGCGEVVSLQSPPRVDAYPPNAFGLYGMGGGAKEWVADCWHRSYQGAPHSGSTPWEAADCRERVLRGGSWMDDAASTTVSSREYYDAAVRYPTHGFRVAKSK
ncbi:MAG: formylglycine-generating enzyme family protein, partial [Janthinobacterium lividum]